MILLEYLRAYLIAEGVARDPRVAGAAPPMWIEVDVPAPGEPKGATGANATEVGATAVLGAFATGGFASKPLEEMIRTRTVAIWIRTRDKQLTDQIDADIRRVLIERERFNWLMGTLRIISSAEWHPLRPYRRDEAQGRIDIAAYAFETYTA